MSTLDRRRLMPTPVTRLDGALDAVLASCGKGGRPRLNGVFCLGRAGQCTFSQQAGASGGDRRVPRPPARAALPLGLVSTQHSTKSVTERGARRTIDTTTFAVNGPAPTADAGLIARLERLPVTRGRGNVWHCCSRKRAPSVSPTGPAHRVDKAV
jgi:hypothetical protein